MLSLAIVTMPFAAAAETLDYRCVVDDVKLSIHVDVQAQTVRQITQSGSTTEIGEYSDRVYGPMSHTGAAAVLIPSVHQFVRITEELIYYGAELHGVEDRAVLNRRLATITLPNGRTGWCF
jgi:hypothetical protein